MKILVTGGAGFLGSNLSRKLLKDGYEVICLDDLSTGRLTNLSDLMDNPNFEFVKMDVNNPLNLEIDGIFNLACPASPIQYQRNPINTLKTNVLGSLNVLDLAERLGVRVLQASTSEIYGDPLENPQREDYWGNVNSIGIRSCYDEGKRAAETLFFDYHRTKDIDIRVMRIFNTYGPGMSMDDGRVVSNFIIQALQNQNITIFGDGKQSRSFCYVDDLILGMSTFFFSNKSVSPTNFGNPLPISMLELAEEIIKLTGSKSKLIFAPLPGDDPKLREPDISRATATIGWSPVVTREQGLTKTIAYFKNELMRNLE
jgi:UDP-glucuronate decarboxylase